MKRYVIGLDYGTLSARGVLVDVENGSIMAESVYEYPHGVMDRHPSSGTALGSDWALQHPGDYLVALGNLIRELLDLGKTDKDQVIGLGIDFTACTLLPLDVDGIPLCFNDTYKGSPHSWVKLWKHHGAQKEADRINELALLRGEGFLNRYGGKVSSEWLLPKVMETLSEDPGVFANADTFIEAGDWIVRAITDSTRRSSCMAGYKALWHKREGYPSHDFLYALNPFLSDLAQCKLKGEVVPAGTKAGGISPRGAELTGLRIGTAVSAPIIDAHAAVPGVGITKPGKMFIIMGTSMCHLLLGEKEIHVPGISGVVEDGILPGYYGYEAGQVCMGDHFAWFAQNACPPEYVEEAKKQGKKTLAFLDEKASILKPGQSGLVALDWWNGNRSVLVDADLTGLVLGYTLKTKAEEIYRALVEATAYGTRMIIETFRESGIPVNEVVAAGGIALKSPFVMQIFADVTGLSIDVSKAKQAGALGAAMFGAVAAGKKNGGYDQINDAANAMACKETVSYHPIEEHVRVYNRLYGEYKRLHDYFGKGENNVMKRLKRLKDEVTA